MDLAALHARVDLGDGDEALELLDEPARFEDEVYRHASFREAPVPWAVGGNRCIIRLGRVRRKRAFA
jgi:hypothetical protein